MMEKSLLQLVINDQRQTKWQNAWVKREIPGDLLSGPDIVVISGIRRCGKSTLIQQIRTEAAEKDYYLNFDDERLIIFTVEDFQLLTELFLVLFGEQHTFYFDEIQAISGWERFVRRLHDQGNKVFVTGSNATMLSRELGTHLTGRYLSLELFPFSFREFLLFHNAEIPNPDRLDTQRKADLIKHFEQYLTVGGFPEYVARPNPLYLKSLYESILYRDIMVRHKLTNEKEMLELVYYLASNATRPTNHTALTKVIGVANPTTIKNYLSFLQDVYLLFTVHLFDYSVKTQLRNARKVYFIDNALLKRLGFQFTPEFGRMLENLIYIELLRRGYEVFYFKNRGECDFVARSGGKVKLLIQVSESLGNNTTRARELSGLQEAMKQFQLNQGLLITGYEEETLQSTEGQILIVPAWKWLLQR